MGNRAVVTFAEKNDIEKYAYDRESPMHIKGFVNDNPCKVGVYLHWSGGYDSIMPFCMACKELGFRSPTYDNYGIACFVQLAKNFFGIYGLSVGVDSLSNLDCDNGDNGVFVVDGEWEIIGREYERDEQTRDNEYYEGFKNYLVGLANAIEHARNEFNAKKFV